MDAIFQSHVTILVRTMQLLVAVGWLAGCAAGTHRTGLQQQLRSEAEDGVLSGGVYVDTEIAGYSGTGYVTNFTASASSLTIAFAAPKARNAPEASEAPRVLYSVTVGYHSAFGDKGFDFRVNDGAIATGMFKQTTKHQWSTVSVGKFALESGRNNTFEVLQGWGYFQVDYIDVSPASVSPPKPPPSTLTDPNATAEAHKLMAFLVSQFGKVVLAGTQGLAATSHVYSVTSKMPALVEGGLIDYSPSREARGAKPKETTEMLLNWTNAGNGHGLLALCWHWNSPCDLMDTPEHPDPQHPWWKGFYTADTNYNLSLALGDRSSKQFALLVSDMDAIAVQLAKLADADVPVLWRPLHEAAGGWFWWGSEGPGPFKVLWRLMYNRFTKVHGLHNLVWTYTETSGGPNAAWYPGDDVVDVVGMDVYNAAGSSDDSEWEAMKQSYGGKKLITLAETGSIVVPNLIRKYETMWSWFNLWDVTGYNITSEDLTRVCNDPIVVTLDEVPDWNDRQ